MALRAVTRQLLATSIAHTALRRSLNTTRLLPAGHSKWANIKHQKARQDKSRSILFARLHRDIVIAIKGNGGNANPESNLRLKTALAAARNADMPKDKIEGALRVGKGEGVQAQVFTFECRGPGGTLMIVEAEAERREHIVPELNKWCQRFEAEVCDVNTAQWAFDKRGRVVVSKADIWAKNPDLQENFDPEEFALNFDNVEEADEDDDEVFLFC
ncbi:uncharacterized protein MONBRDRAFT_38616, partial [Monosiga brevicollis MX1]